MATLIAAYNSSGCIGRCDAKCYDAIHPDCDCICGGANHGCGQQQAFENTTKLFESWIEDYNRTHDDVIKYEIPALNPVQLNLFELLEA